MILIFIAFVLFLCAAERTHKQIDYRKTKQSNNNKKLPLKFTIVKLIRICRFVNASTHSIAVVHKQFYY